eukprot:COSAG02_NODE_67975_length_251_cov_1.368421_1_plen_32_part_10
MTAWAHQPTYGAYTEVIVGWKCDGGEMHTAFR